MADRYALLIGISKFNDPTLHPLAAPKSDVDSLHEVLRDPRIGDFQCILLDNCTMEAARTAIIQHFSGRTADDVVLLYYTGHGLRDADGNLCLALPETDAAAPGAISIDADFIKKRMSLSNSDRQILILDCCHAGAVRSIGGKGSGPILKQELDSGGHGRFTLAATSAEQSAFEMNGESVFTKHLVDGIKEGKAAPNSDTISIDDIYRYAQKKVADSGLSMQPVYWVEKATEPVLVAYNPKPKPKLPTDLVDLLWKAERAESYLGADKLIEIMLGDEDSLSKEAYGKLQARLGKKDMLSAELAEKIGKGFREFDERVRSLPRTAEKVEVRTDTIKESVTLNPANAIPTSQGYAKKYKAILMKSVPVIVLSTALLLTGYLLYFMATIRANWISSGSIFSFFAFGPNYMFEHMSRKIPSELVGDIGRRELDIGLGVTLAVLMYCVVMVCLILYDLKWFVLSLFKDKITDRIISASLLLTMSWPILVVAGELFSVTNFEVAFFTMIVSLISCVVFIALVLHGIIRDLSNE